MCWNMIFVSQFFEKNLILVCHLTRSSIYLAHCSCLLVLFCIIMLRWLALACPLSEYEKGKSTFPRWPDRTFPKACVACTVYEVLEMSEKRLLTLLLFRMDFWSIFYVHVWCAVYIVVWWDKSSGFSSSSGWM